MAATAKLPIFVEIANEPIIPARSGISGKSGQRYEIGAQQNCYYHNVGRYPVAGEVPVPETGPYRPGLYLIGGECLEPGQYGLKLEERAVLLIPMEDALKALAAAKAPA